MAHDLLRLLIQPVPCLPTRPVVEARALKKPARRQRRIENVFPVNPQRRENGSIRVLYLSCRGVHRCLTPRCRTSSKIAFPSLRDGRRLTNPGWSGAGSLFSQLIIPDFCSSACGTGQLIRAGRVADCSGWHKAARVHGRINADGCLTAFISSMRRIGNLKDPFP